jgi:hypothetical protein
MTTERVRAHYMARPFQPFAIHLADGGQINVPHPEFMLISPSGRTVVVTQPDDTFNIIDLLLVTDLEITADLSIPKDTNGPAS